MCIRDRLQINGEGDNIRVEVLDKNSRITNTAKSGKLNALRWEPSWEVGRDLAVSKGEFIQLRFYLENAKLYAFKVIDPLPR